MQLASENDIDESIRELQRALPIVALQRVIKTRELKHKPTADLSRVLRLKVALQITEEMRGH